MDAQVGRLLERLRKHGAYEDLVVLVVADHGEMLGEPGRRAQGHSTQLVEETVHVPLMVRAPTITPHRVPNLRVRTVDIFPTLLEAAGLPIPADREGRSLFDLSADAAPRLSYSETLYEHYPARAKLGEELVGIRYGGWSLRHRKDGVELFDLERDPSELNDVAAQHPEKVTELRQRLAALATRWPEKPRLRHLQLNPEETADHLERLRALGYVQ